MTLYEFMSGNVSFMMRYRTVDGGDTLGSLERGVCELQSLWECSMELEVRTSGSSPASIFGDSEVLTSIPY